MLFYGITIDLFCQEVQKKRLAKRKGYFVKMNRRQYGYPQVFILAKSKQPSGKFVYFSDGFSLVLYWIRNS